MNPPVFLGAAGVVVAFVVLGGLFSETSAALFGALQEGIVRWAGWFYVLVASGFLVLALYLGLGPYGRIRLGGDDARPEFGFASWFAMLLAAGMGIGVAFFGAAEPLAHWSQPPTGAPSSGEPVRDAMRLTFHHWGLHAWGIYAAFAVPLAYYHFRHDLPLAPRSLLWPLLGERIHGGLGHAVDVLCTVGTLFGVATSLGLGATQINAGLHALFGLPVGIDVQLILIAGITLAATLSVVSGLHRGMRLLSQSNMVLAGLLLLFVLATGPTLYLLELFTTSLGAYLQKLPATSLWTEPGPSEGWQARWTLFYWSWWISWSPFVGVFVARISRGRTLSEFIVATLALPSLATFFWFSVMGGTGIHLTQAGAAGGLASRAVEQPPLSLFLVLGELPLAGLTQAAATLLVLTFFVTSSDSGSLVDDMVTSGGHPDPPRAQRVFWALAEGAVAATLLMAGGLEALRTASLTTGLPISILLLVSGVGLLRALRVDASVAGVPSPETLHEGRARRPEG